MAPFDFTHGEEDLLNGISFNGLKDWTIERKYLKATDLVIPPVPSNAPTVQAKRAYPLADNARIAFPDASLVSFGPCARSMRTPSYLEHLLQVFDKNATMSSIIVLIVYAGLLKSL